MSSFWVSIGCEADYADMLADLGVIFHDGQLHVSDEHQNDTGTFDKLVGVLLHVWKFCAFALGEPGPQQISNNQRRSLSHIFFSPLRHASPRQVGCPSRCATHIGASNTSRRWKEYNPKKAGYQSESFQCRGTLDSPMIAAPSRTLRERGPPGATPPTPPSESAGIADASNILPRHMR